MAAAIEGESSKTNLWNIRQGQVGPELVTSLDKVASEILVLNDGNILLRYVTYLVDSCENKGFSFGGCILSRLQRRNVNLSTLKC